jgi:hypothetical protein
MKNAGTRALSIRRAGRTALLLVCIAAVSACGGGAVSTLSSTPSGPARQSHALLSITIPAAKARSARGRNYVSAATASGSFAYPGNPAPQTFALTPGSPGCTTTADATSCKITVNAPVGDNEMLTVSLFDANGKTLSTVTTTATIVSGQTTPLTFTLDGVVSAISLAFNPPTLPPGQSGTTAVVLNALDADGNTIIAPGGYADANGNQLTISLADSDTSGATSLSKNSVTAPTSGLTLAYNGSKSLSSVTVTASAPGVTSQMATLDFVVADGCASGTPSSTKSLYAVGQGSPQIDYYGLGSQADTYDTNLSPALGPAFGIAVDSQGTTYLEIQETLLLMCPGASTVHSYLPIQADGEIVLSNPGTIAVAQPMNFFTKDADAIAFYGIGSFVPYDDQSLDADPVPSPSPPPSSEISGTSTGLDAPFGLAFDSTGQAYVGNNSNVTVYAANARGNVGPKSTISLPNAGLVEPLDVGTDGVGNVYVLYALDLRPGGGQTPAVAEYAAGSNGAAPIAVISGAATELGTFKGKSPFNQAQDSVTALAVDASGDVYVGSLTPSNGATNQTSGGIIYEYAAGSNGNVAPEKSFVPTFYNYPVVVTSLAATSTVLYSLNSGYQITAFGPGSKATTFTPEQKVGGQGYNVYSLRVDAAGDLFASASLGVSGTAGNGIIEFPVGSKPNSDGAEIPTKTFGSSSAFGNPFAVSPAGTVYEDAALPEPSIESVHDGYFFGNYTAPMFTTSVNVFSGGSTTATSNLTGAFYSTAFIADATGHLFNVGVDNDVEQLSASGSGLQAPAASFSDFLASTLSATANSYDSSGVALDSKNNLYVASTLTNSISVFAPGATTPSREIVGLKTMLYHPQGMVIDAAGNLYVGSVGTGILVFGPSANGNVAPSFVDLPGSYFLAIGPSPATAKTSMQRAAGEAASGYGAPLGFGRPESGQLTPAAYFARFRQASGQR